MMKNILVAMDDSPHSWTARQYASDLARGYNATVKALTVADTGLVATPPGWGFDLTPLPWPRSPEGSTATAVKSLEEIHLDLLNKAQKKFEEEGVRFRTIYRHGLPDDIIIDEASTADLVVMGHRGLGRSPSMLDMVIGSTASSVVRRVNKPVFIAPETYQSLDRILLAYDDSPHANHALQWAADVATTLQLPIVVLSVHKQTGEASVNVLKAKEYLSAYPVQVTPVSLTRYGQIADDILWVASDHKCNLIVMGAYGHSPLREMVLGSTTEKVMNETTVPLLLMK
jgi:nucleotide-binding universal stress UspA family protein